MPAIASVKGTREDYLLQILSHRLISHIDRGFWNTISLKILIHWVLVQFSDQHKTFWGYCSSYLELLWRARNRDWGLGPAPIWLPNCCMHCGNAVQTTQSLGSFWTCICSLQRQGCATCEDVRGRNAKAIPHQEAQSIDCIEYLNGFAAIQKTDT